MFPKRIDLRFKSTKGRAFGLGKWKDAVSFPNWVFIIALINSTMPDDVNIASLAKCDKSNIIFVQ